MGSLLNKSFYIGRRQIEHTVRTHAQGNDILSKATKDVLQILPYIQCRTLKNFEEIVKSYSASIVPHKLVYIATVSAFAVSVHQRGYLPLTGLVNIIERELDLHGSYIVE